MLTEVEGRVLGCLLEKERTTPDQYPLTLNALVSACNQSTAREPVMRVEPDDVERALDSLKQQRMVRFVHPSHGRSVTRFRQVIDELQQWSAAQSAAVALLLLRGAQTSAELRARAERLHDYASIEEVETVLAELAIGEQPVVRRLERQPGRKEARWQQLLADEAEPAALHSPERGALASAGRHALEARVDELEARVARLEAALAELL